MTKAQHWTRFIAPAAVAALAVAPVALASEADLQLPPIDDKIVFSVFGKPVMGATLMYAGIAVALLARTSSHTRMPAKPANRAQPLQLLARGVAGPVQPHPHALGVLAVVARELVGPGELPAAVLPRALVRLLARVRPQVGLQVRRFRVRLCAAGVRTGVRRQPLAAPRAPAANAWCAAARRARC